MPSEGLAKIFGYLPIYNVGAYLFLQRVNVSL